MRPIFAAAFLIPVSLVPAKAQTFSDNYRQFVPWPFAPPGIYRPHAERGGSVSRACLTAQTRAVLARLEASFGSVKVISTCRRGAVIAGTRRPSLHRYGMAVDFVPPPGHRAGMINWLRANSGGMVITYRSGHVHFDTGSYRNVACSECGTRRVRRSHAAAR